MFKLIFKKIHIKMINTYIGNTGQLFLLSKFMKKALPPFEADCNTCEWHTILCMQAKQNKFILTLSYFLFKSHTGHRCKYDLYMHIFLLVLHWWLSIEHICSIIRITVYLSWIIKPSFGIIYWMFISFTGLFYWAFNVRLRNCNI